MTSIRRVISEKRMAVAAAGILVLADLLLYGLAVQPARTGVVAARQRAARATEDHAARETDLRAARARLERVNRASAQLKKFHAEVLPHDLARARTLTYPQLASLAARHDLSLERRTSDHDPDEDARLDRLRTTLQLAGRYGDIRRFVEAIETAPDFLIIDEIALSRREAESDGALVVTLGVSTYFPAAEGAS
ncbi:MAG: GspMb/PilO family protein [Acidobacteria bacterium]|nr:GspMb/PilO family protein [Acidobacteriota bacterium]